MNRRQMKQQAGEWVLDLDILKGRKRIGRPIEELS
jgi:hypothetical protein